MMMMGQQNLLFYDYYLWRKHYYSRRIYYGKTADDDGLDPALSMTRTTHLFARGLVELCGRLPDDLFFGHDHSRGSKRHFNHNATTQDHSSIVSQNGLGGCCGRTATGLLLNRVAYLWSKRRRVKAPDFYGELLLLEHDGEHPSLTSSCERSALLKATTFFQRSGLRFSSSVVHQKKFINGSMADDAPLLAPWDKPLIGLKPNLAPLY